MNIEVKRKHKITFRVEAFWSEEGGMGRDEFPSPNPQPCETIEAALHRLEFAREADPKTRWIITGTAEEVK